MTWPPGFVRISSLLVLLTLSACAALRQREAAPAAPATDGISVTDFGTLRWLEGRWQGTMPDGAPFYEGYRFANDSTIRTYTYPDATALTPSDSGAVTLRAGVVATGSGGSRWEATELREGHVHFAPRENATNAFTWERVSADAWVATLTWPASASRPAGRVIYHIQRLPR